jgi:1-piperideine-2-carboxylate/1-pyrroline-2-carboxylate reductase [NAD(P)H]
MPAPSPHELHAADTAARLPFRALVDALRDAALELARGAITAPARQAIGLPHGGTLLSMAAVAPDVAVHKLVTIVPGNAERGLPTLLGHVDVLDAASGQARLRLDAPTLTGRRTAALSMLGIETLAPSAPASPRCVLIIGTGAQALHHVLALRALHPAVRIEIMGRTREATERFCAAHHFQGARLPGHADAWSTAASAVAGVLYPLQQLEASKADVVVTCTTSRTPVYTLPASNERLLIGVGAYRPETAEIAPATVRASRCYVDEPEGARHEAGDLIGAGVDWAQVRPLAQALARRPALDAPVLLKTVGCAAWDLAAARVALATAPRPAQ